MYKIFNKFYDWVRENCQHIGVEHGLTPKDIYKCSNDFKVVLSRFPRDPVDKVVMVFRDGTVLWYSPYGMRAIYTITTKELVSDDDMKNLIEISALALEKVFEEIKKKRK